MWNSQVVENMCTEVQVMMPEIGKQVTVVNVTEAQCMMTVMYIMNTVLTDIQVQVMMANIITKVAVVNVTEAQCMMTACTS